MESAITEPARDAFDRIFHPKSVAVIGVSASGYAFGTGILSSLKAIGFEGRLYAVNPKGGEYNGMKLYTGLSMIPSQSISPLSQYLRACAQCPRRVQAHGVAGAEILSAVLRARHRGGRPPEQEIRDIASRGIRVVRPNCFGIYCPQSGLTLLPGPDLSRKSGPVGFVSQSGGMAIDFAHIGKWMGVGFSKMVSFAQGPT